MKRGMIHGTLIGLILLLLAFGIVYVWAAQLGLIADEDSNAQICWASLAAQDITQIGSGYLALNSPLSTRCLRRITTITSNSIGSKLQGRMSILSRKVRVAVKDNDRYRLTSGYREVNADVLQGFVAESLRRCWTMTGQGKAKVLNDESFLNQNYCIICEEVAVDLDEPSVSLNMGQFMTEANIPASGALTQSYATFLRRGEDGDDYPNVDSCRSRLRLDDPDEIRDGSYATVFVRRFGASKGDTFFTNDEYCAAVAFLPVSRVRNLCVFVAN